MSKPIQSLIQGRLRFLTSERPLDVLFRVNKAKLGLNCKINNWVYRDMFTVNSKRNWKALKSNISAYRIHLGNPLTRGILYTLKSWIPSFILLKLRIMAWTMVNHNGHRRTFDVRSEINFRNRAWVNTFQRNCSCIILINLLGLWRESSSSWKLWFYSWILWTVSLKFYSPRLGFRSWFPTGRPLLSLVVVQGALLSDCIRTVWLD